MKVGSDQQGHELLPEADVQEAVRHFISSLQTGANWFDALLQTIALWPAGQEVHDGRRYQYLVGGEAFDWLLLAERLTLSADGLIPEESRDQLLFHGRLPRPLSEDEFKEVIGSAKYRAVCNYWYGVAVEEALVLAVEHEVRKQRRGLRPEDLDLDNAVYQRIYGQSLTELLRQFYAERDEPAEERSSLTNLKEFTYWLFKYRLKCSEPARLASDTRKGLDFLHLLGRRPPHG